MQVLKQVEYQQLTMCRMFPHTQHVENVVQLTLKF